MPARLIDQRSQREYAVREEGTSVGRHGDNDIALFGMALSRFHARLHQEKSSWIIEDLGSSHGTFVNGRRVEGQVELHDGDKLRLAVTRHYPEGEFNLVFHAEPAPRGLVARLKRAVRTVIARRTVEEGKMLFEHAGETLVVRLSGLFRRPEMDSLADALKKAEAVRPLSVVMDLTAVRHLNSYGLAVLMELAGWLRENGRSLRVFGATGTVRKLLLIPGEESPIKVCASEEEALSSG
jgi:anti-anti-sigma factor